MTTVVCLDLRCCLCNIFCIRTFAYNAIKGKKTMNNFTILIAHRSSVFKYQFLVIFLNFIFFVCSFQTRKNIVRSNFKHVLIVKNNCRSRIRYKETLNIMFCIVLLTQNWNANQKEKKTKNNNNTWPKALAGMQHFMNLENRIQPE